MLVVEFIQFLPFKILLTLKCIIFCADNLKPKLTDEAHSVAVDTILTGYEAAIPSLKLVHF